MKQRGLRKLASMILAVVMCLGLTCTAFADDVISDDTTYSITITNANVGETYAAYKIFDAVYSGSNVTYYIDDEDDYYEKVAENAAQTSGALFTLVETGTTGYYQVVRNEGVTDNDITAFFTGVSALGSVSAQDTAESASLTLYPGAAGYYFVTTTTGSVVSIDSAYPTASITDKNSEPTVEKTEMTDGTAGVGDTVEYQATISAAEDVTTLVYHDKMSTGLDFDSTSVIVKIGNDTLEASSDYNVLIGDDMKDNTCTFEIEFTATGLGKVDEEETIVITYSATVNARAITVNALTNEASLSYGNDSTSESSTTYTYTYDISIFKYTGTDTALANANFILYKVVNETNYYAIVSSGVLSGWTTDRASATTLTSGSDGKIAVDGLDAGTYYLEETEAPAGYNQLTAAITIVISDDDKDGTATVSYTYNGTTSTGEIKVLNKAGAVLPSTGGIGTTIFYIVGGVLVLGAAVLFVTKKRLGSEN